MDRIVKVGVHQDRKSWCPLTDEIHYGFYCQVFDSDDMKLLADAGLRIWFVDYPLVLSMSTDKERVAPGQPLAVTVTYLNLSESAISGRLVLRAEGLPVSEPELDLGPNEAGSVQTTLNIPADAGLGQVTLMGRYIEGFKRTSCDEKRAEITNL